MPHRSATTAEARAEEARLLHVAVTRASDLLVLTWSARRGGYRRQASPLIAGIDTAAAPTVPPPPSLRTVPPTDRAPLDRLAAWRERMARMAMILPDRGLLGRRPGGDRRRRARRPRPSWSRPRRSVP